jgi:hypothetical protein
MKKLIATAAALILALVLSCTAFAEGTTVHPLPVQTNVDELGGRYVTTDIEYKGNSIMELTLYEIERFDGAALKAVKPGDAIESEGETIAVESVEWDGPDLYFNRDTNHEMLFCSPDEEVTFERVIRDEDDRNTMVKIGTREQEVLPYMIMLDWVDAETGEPYEDLPALRSGDDLLKLLEKNDGPSFAVKNVKILYNSMNMPDLVWRYYSPAQ